MHSLETNWDNKIYTTLEAHEAKYAWSGWTQREINWTLREASAKFRAEIVGKSADFRASAPNTNWQVRELKDWEGWKDRENKNAYMIYE